MLEEDDMQYYFTAVITREDGFFVSECVDLGIASQGKSIDESLANLKEAIHLFLKNEEISELNLPAEHPLVTTLEVAV